MLVLISTNVLPPDIWELNNTMHRIYYMNTPLKIVNEILVKVRKGHDSGLFMGN